REIPEVTEDPTREPTLDTAVPTLLAPKAAATLPTGAEAVNAFAARAAPPPTAPAAPPIFLSQFQCHD
ncbi:hypothetical protein ACFDR8_000001, partial [Arthrobacter sp. MP_2.3]